MEHQEGTDLTRSEPRAGARRLEALRTAAMEARMAGQSVRAIELFHAVEEAAVALDDHATEAWAILRQAATYEHLGRHDECAALARRASLLASQRGHRLLAADALAVLGATYFAIGDVVAAMDAAVEATFLLETQAEAQAELPYVLNNVGVTYAYAELQEEAVAHYGRAIEHWEAHGDQVNAAYGTANLGTALVEWGLRLLTVGERQEAVEKFELGRRTCLEALERARGSVQALTTMNALVALAIAEIGLGELDAGARRAGELIAEARRHAYATVECMALYAVGSAAWQQGRHRDSEAALHAALAVADRIDSRRWYQTVQRELVRAYQAAGELERALAVVRQLEQALASQLEVERQQRVEHLKLTLQLGHVREHAETLSRENEALRTRSSQLTRLSLEDALTGLGNRRFFDTRLTELCQRVARRGGRLSLAIADIDGFKAINDAFSYGVGDRVLQTVAGILRRCSRDRDLAVRWGGEEFVLAFVDTPLPEATVVAERLREAVAEFPWQQIDADLEVTMSVGLAGDLAGHGLLALHTAADGYLKAAKRGGKNRLVAGPVPP